MRERLVVVSLLSVFACTTDPNSTDDGPDPCADELADKGEFWCGPTYQPACDALAGDADRAVRWLVAWADNPPSELQLDCAQTWLDNSGLIGPATAQLYFPVEASYAEIAELCRAEMIGACEPEALATDCDTLDEIGCAADPLCADIRGTRIPDGQVCVELEQWAGCKSTTTSCPAVEVTAEHDDGSCWLFSSGCLPTSGAFTPSDACPDSGTISGWPEC